MATILIVEDRPIDRKFLATLLKSAGHTVAEASDGAEALRVAERIPPDLIISDILMPTVDGFAFVLRMRDIEALARTPVIFYTATYHEREARKLAEQCGVNAILTKPSAPKDILAKVDAVLASPAGALAPLQNRADFATDQVRVVSAALASKIEEFEASEQRMAAIVDIAHQIAAERDPRRMMDKVCTAAREVTLAQHAIISMLTADSSAVVSTATSGIDDEAMRQMEVASITGPPFKAVLTEHRPVRICSPDGRPEAIGLPASHPPVYSYLVVPIESRSQIYGCLGLLNKLGAPGFSQRDEEVTLALATHAGVAYENARLYDDLRRRSGALEQEVAERRRVEAALRENDERTRFALAAARMGVWEVELASGRLTWSDTMAAVFGLDSAQAPKTMDGLFDLVHSDDRASVQEDFDCAALERTDFVNEFRAVWPDGTVHWVAGRARVLPDRSGAAVRMIGVGMDIGDRKSLEDQLRQSQKMEAIGQLAGGVAHDFNNLLTAIRGYADLVSGTLSEGDHRRTDLAEVIKAADRAADLTRQLLAFSRKQVIQPSLVEVNGLVLDTIKMLRRVIGEDIDLVTELAPETTLVHVDPGQLEQILMNLAVNARDAMPKGGRLSIETANVTLDQSHAIQPFVVRPGPYVMLGVSDTGIGMDAQTRERVFEPFFTTKERGRGTGLGLATVYGIVKQSGGHIVLDSEPGLGAAFSVYLPRAENVDFATPPTIDAAQAPTGSETILLVEDEQAVRFLSRVLLERAGYSVLDAGDPQHAALVFQQYGPAIDLLVTDVIMPGSSGPTLFKHLSAERPDLKVLYISGYTDDVFGRQAGLASDVVFLEKPFTADRLMFKVREALDR